MIRSSPRRILPTVIRFLLFLVLFVGFVPVSALCNEWERIPLPPNVEYLATLAAGNRYLFASMTDSSGAYLGLYRTPLDSPGSWEYLGLEGRNVRGVVTAGEEDQQLLVGASGQPLVTYSSDGGSTWESRFDRPTFETFRTMAWNGESPGRVYVSAKTNYVGDYDSIGVFMSTDFGESWSYWHRCYSCITTGLIRIAVPQTGGLLAWGAQYTGYWTMIVSKTVDGGSTWDDLSDPNVPWAFPLDLEVSVLDPEECYCLIEGGGNVWYEDEIVGSFVPPLGVQLAIELPPWHPGVMYAAGRLADGRAGVTYASDPLDDWVFLNAGLPAENLPERPDWDWYRYQFEAAPGQPRLFLALWGLGLWTRDLSDVASVSVDGGRSGSTLTMSAPHPNPTTGSTRIDFRVLATAPHLSIEVFDVRGRVVRRLEPSGEGHPYVVWDGRVEEGGMAAPGVYHLRVRSGGEQLVRRVVVVR